MIKLATNRIHRKTPWGGGNMFFKALYENSMKYDICTIHSWASLIIPDKILILGLDTGENEYSAENVIEYYKRLWKNNLNVQNKAFKIPVVIRVNDCDARKGTTDVDEKLLKLSKIVDGTIFVSEWLKEYFLSRGWECKNNIVIHNGVDTDIFKKREKISPSMKNIVTHHWSDNPLKGKDIYEKLDEWVGQNEDYTFTYIGRHKCNFKNTRVIPPLYGEELGKELGKYDIYVSASRFDPGPNHCLESIACEMPTFVHADGGGAVELVGGQKYSYKNFDELIDEIKACHQKNDANIISWAECIEKYTSFLKKI